MKGAAAPVGNKPSEVGLRQELKAVRGLFPYLWPREWDLRGRVLLSLAFLVAAKLVSVYVPLLYKGAVDALSPGRSTAIVVPAALIVFYGLGRVGAQLFAEVRDAVFAKVGQRAVRRVALATFRHMHALSLRFHLERQTGGLSRAIERGIRGTEFLLSYLLFNVVPTLFEILLVCGILWSFYDASFALVTLAVIVAYIVFTFTVTDWRVKFRREMNERDSEANTKAIDSLLNFETVKYFANEEHEAQRFDRALRAYERAAVKSQTTLSALNIGQGMIIAAGLVVVMLLAGRGVARGSMTVGDFVLVNAYLVQLYAPLNVLGMVYRNIKQSLTDFESMFRLLGVRAEIEDRPGAPPLRIGRGEIVFDHVSFRYDQRRPILHDVSFRVPPGGTLAIVGPDLRAVTQESLRQAIGVVPQDTVLFNDTIRYNIAYGRTGASDEEIVAAARHARIADFVASLPDGYRSMVGERGLKLSGGEKQRVAIARVILKEPSILVFDEATSALDTKTEQEIQASLDEVRSQRTTLVIAHRLSTVVNADEILVLDEGRIVERGNHALLLAQGGVYAAMWARQQELDEREAALAAVAE